MALTSNPPVFRLPTEVTLNLLRTLSFESLSLCSFTFFFILSLSTIALLTSYAF